MFAPKFGLFAFDAIDKQVNNHTEINNTHLNALRF